MPETRLRQLFRGEGVSPYLIDVLPKKLTIDSAFVPRYLRQSSHTLFKEVSRIPFEEAVPEGLRQLALIPRGSGESGLNLYKQLGDLLLQVIEDHWWPEGVHVILHSSGIDSRLISWALGRLRDKMDLGQILFLCSRDEKPAFYEIMKYEGWAAHQYYVVDEAITPARRWARELLNFENFWEQHAGPSVVPFNTLWYLVAEAQQKGILPPHIQVWSGYWANEFMGYTTGPAGVLATAERLYACTMAALPIKGTEVVLPLIDFRLLLALLASPGEFSRAAWLKYLDPKLASFENMGWVHKKPPKIDSEILGLAQAAYSGSWYGQRVASQVKLPNAPLKRPAWGYFSAASFTSHLMQVGYEINV